jgi:hypothetical protein
VAVAAIGFGVPCSFQLGAALSVFSAAQRPWLAVAYFALLAVSLVAYLRISYPTPRSALRSWSLHTTPAPATLDGRYLLRAVWDNLVSFLRTPHCRLRSPACARMGLFCWRSHLRSRG